MPMHLLLKVHLICIANPSCIAAILEQCSSMLLLIGICWKQLYVVNPARLAGEAQSQMLHSKRSLKRGHSYFCCSTFCR